MGVFEVKTNARDKVEVEAPKGAASRRLYFLGWGLGRRLACMQTTSGTWGALSTPPAESGRITDRGRFFDRPYVLSMKKTMVALKISYFANLLFANFVLVKKQ